MFDKNFERVVFTIWGIGLAVSIAVTAFVCWAIYTLVQHFAG